MTPPRIDALADPVAVAVGGLAVYRLTRLATEDTITGPAREVIVRRGYPWPDPEDPRPDYRSGPAGWRVAAGLVTCPWCVSVWLAAGWAAAVVAAPRAARVAGTALAWSAVSGLLSSWE